MKKPKTQPLADLVAEKLIERIHEMPTRKLLDMAVVLLVDVAIGRGITRDKLLENVEKAYTRIERIKKRQKAS